VIPDKAFYVDPKNVNDTTFFLNKEESHHVTKVFRLALGSKISLLNGIGSGYIAKIDSVNGGIVFGTIEDKLESFGENKYDLNIAPAVIKRDRFESLLEKVTELGVKEIYPLITDRCIKNTINMTRCRKIIISASKQCQRSHFPLLHEPIDMNTWLNSLEGQCFAGIKNVTYQLSDMDIEKENVINIMIGPEGDFSPKEIEMLKKKGVRFYTLGNRRLRSETAAQSSLSILNELMI
jgi:16S rRNA (uracil1498-N3)-methyltransferase